MKQTIFLVLTGTLSLTSLPQLVTSVPSNFSLVATLKRSSRAIAINDYNAQRCIGCNDESANQCTRRTFKSAKQYADKIKCQPELTYVKLDVPGPAFSLEPSVAKVYRCSGVCKQHYHSCLPLKTSFIKVPVILGHHHEKSYKCVEYEIEQHEECTCDCQVKEEDCSEMHKHDRCACQCPNVADMIQCLQNQGGPGKRSVWDEDKCQCVCEAEPCMDGSEWDSTKCRCENDADNLLY